MHRFLFGLFLICTVIDDREFGEDFEWREFGGRGIAPRGMAIMCSVVRRARKSHQEQQQLDLVDISIPVLCFVSTIRRRARALF